MPQEHTLTLTVEASGEVTPAPATAEPGEAQPNEEMTDG